MEKYQMTKELLLNMTDYIAFIKEVCDKHKWTKNWSQGGCYIHLEVSEFIEACRGKGDPEDELGDVLFTLLAVADYYGIDPMLAINKNTEKHRRILNDDIGC